MSSEHDVGGSTAAPQTFGPWRETTDVLTEPRRSAIVAVLARERRPITTRELASLVAAREDERVPAEISDDRRRSVLVSLRHNHVPRLSDAGYVDWERDEGTVAYADDAPLPADRAAALLESRPRGHSAWTTEATDHPRRRAILFVTAGRDGSLDVEELATLVAARERGCEPAELSDTDVDRIRISLYHSHLPALSSANLLEYDADSGRVTV